MNKRSNPPTKILFVIPSLSGGGAERVLVHILNHLDKSSYDISLVLFKGEGKYIRDVIGCTKLWDLKNKSRFSFFALIYRLRKVIKELNPDAVVSILHYANIVSILASLFLHEKPRTIVCEQNYHRAYIANLRFGLLRKFLMKFTYGKSDIVVAVSEKLREALIVDFNLNAGKVKVIHNAIPFGAIEQLCKEKAEEEFFSSKNGKMIIAVGRLTQQKRFDRLIGAFALVREEREACLLILGQGELSDELKNLSKQLKVGEHVRFVGFKDNPYAWISKADMLVLSSDYEGFPMIILEAMACGTPVISTNCPSGPSEIITNGKNGILCSPMDENELSKAMLALLDRKELREKLSNEGKKRAADFKIENIVKQYEALL